MISYDKIRANVLDAQGYSRPNRFLTDFSFPSVLTGKQLIDAERLSINCSSANLPGRAFEQSETSYSGGYAHKKATNTTFSDLECVFYLSEDLYEKQIFDAWQSFIFDPNYQVSTYPEDYYGTVSVTKQTKGVDQTNEYTYIYTNVFPINVQDVIQSYENSSVIDLLPVTFSYHRWYMKRNFR